MIGYILKRDFIQVKGFYTYFMELMYFYKGEVKKFVRRKCNKNFN